MRVACVQLDCQHGQVERNARRAHELTAGLNAGDVDLIMLPEMALSGYIFSDVGEIEPFLEDPSGGIEQSPSLALATTLAKRLACYVCIGLPCRASAFDSSHKAEGDGVRQRYKRSSQPHDARLKGKGTDVVVADHAAYNASLLVDEKGAIVHIFRKHFAYENDKVWSQEGPGFEWVDLPGLGRVCVAICMDINPYDFQAPFDAFELARYCKSEGVDLLLMNMAWLLSPTGENDSEREDDAGEERAACLQHCNYFAVRLTPLIGEKAMEASAENGATMTTESNGVEEKRIPPFHFIDCNRTGTENGSTFAGFSTALRFDFQSLPQMLGVMGRQEGVKIFDTNQKEV